MKVDRLAKSIIMGIVIVLMLSGAIQSVGNYNHSVPGNSDHQINGHIIPTNGPGKYPVGQQVNVNNLYSTEPAPMGIADYGIGPGGSPYSYSTTSFLGNINIQNLETYNASLNGSSTQLTFQLNINYVFYVGSTEYVYWVQNVADFNTSATPSIGFIDNVWNETGRNTSVYNSTLSGNGTVGNSSGTYFYYSFANQSLPGNDIYVSYPLNIEMAINYTSTPQGIPELIFMYNDGHGWQLYDNVLFKFATNVTKVDGFVVDGYGYEPDGYSFYDAELILGGPGDGTQTLDVKSSVSLQLEYYNGHNYQMVTNAYNFGSDTAEGISNVTSAANYYTSNGSLFSSIKNGTGKLAQIYNRGQIGILNVSATGLSGYVLVNSTKYNFVGGDANLTIAPGTYDVKVYNSKGTLLVQKNETFTAGGYRFLSTSSTYRVTFMSSGIPSGATWYLNLSDGTSMHSASQNLSTNLTNGSYTFNASSGGTYRASGSFNVSGADMTVDVVFKSSIAKTYEIVFQESGLITGKPWNVTLNGSLKSSTSSSIVFDEMNGTYNFTVGSVSGYVSTPSSGKTIVSGKNVSVSIIFSPAVTPSKYSVIFVESGLVTGIWYVNMTDGQSAYSSTTTLSFLLPNGTYNYSVSTGNLLFTSTPVHGSFAVSGSSLRVNVTFNELLLSLEFNETGLPSGSKWSVTLNGTTESSLSNNITFLVTPGTYVYLISAPSGYTAFQLSGIVKVVNSSLTVHTAFSKSEYSVTFLISGLPSGTLWTITFDGASFTTSFNSVSFTVTDGSYLFTMGSVTGYSVQPGTGTLIVNGSSITESIVYSKIAAYGYFTGSITPSNATIYVNGQSYSQLNGQFNISLSPGTYQVKIEAPGYTTYTTNITVSSSTITPLQVHSIAKAPGATSSSLLEKVAIGIVAILIVSLIAVVLRRRRA